MTLSNLLTRFKEDERGVATIESLLWMPLFFYLFILITDVSFIFYGKAQGLRAVQDGNRAFATNQLDRDEAEQRILTKLNSFAPGSTASTEYDGSTGLITTTATLPAASLMAVGSIPNFINLDIRIRESHYQEN
jgi:Flp pilus assembly protein TadG